MSESPDSDSPQPSPLPGIIAGIKQAKPLFLKVVVIGVMISVFGRAWVSGSAANAEPASASARPAADTTRRPPPAQPSSASRWRPSMR